VIDFEPSDDQKLISETVRQFAANEIRPAAREAAESARLPVNLLARAHELGLVASALGSAYGGGGERSAVTGALVAEELAWGDLALALAILSPSLLAFPLQDFGSEEQRRAQLPRFTAQQFAPGSLAIVEPRFDADALRPKTRARRVGADYVLDGRKCFVPWLDGGEAVLVVADESGTPQAYLVPRDAPGLAAEPERNMGLEALPTVELELAGVRVPASARLGGQAGADVGAIVRRGRIGLAAAAVGLARASYEIARDYAKERETFGAPIATRQAIAFKLADMAIEIDAVRLLVWEAAWTLDRGADARRAAALAWDQATRVALDVADGAVQVLGGHGYTREYLPELHLRNARGLALFEALTLV
jgi:alkylation response protein AidB-like acyl-CoA dehydrogenase